MGKTTGRILLTTSCRKKKGYYDYWSENVTRWLRYRYPQKFSPGLRFLKVNIPELDILEYPTWKQYMDKLDEGYDIVGFSFFTHEIPRILEMVKAAREKGIKEIWAGNYGALTYGMEDYFDKIFIGYSERELGEYFGRDIQQLEHPLLIEYLGIPFNLAAIPIGVIYTSRGCNIGCSFCQTPVFCKKIEKIPLESLERVLYTYRRLGVNEVLIGDENFGILKRHTRDAIELLKTYGINWYVMTRTDTLLHNFDEWYGMGFSGTFLGIETLDQKNLNEVGKNLDVNKTEELLKRVKDKNILLMGFYIIGFENETEDSIRRSIIKLNRDYSIDMLQICILTPFPRTKLWDEIEDKYGIFETDWSRWDTKHLVWNHPEIPKDNMESLLKWGFKVSYSPKKFVSTPIKHYLLRRSRKGSLRSIGKMTSDFFHANISYRRPPPI